MSRGAAGRQAAVPVNGGAGGGAAEYEAALEGVESVRNVLRDEHSLLTQYKMIVWGRVLTPIQACTHLPPLPPPCESAIAFAHDSPCSTAGAGCLDNTCTPSRNSPYTCGACELCCCLPTRGGVPAHRRAEGTPPSCKLRYVRLLCCR